MTMRTMTAFAAFATAALLATPAAAQGGGPVGSGNFCLKSATGELCAYQTMAECEKAKPAGSNQQCVERSSIGGTTGSGANMPQPGSSSPSSPKSPPSR
jgi:hypothetical protein